MWVNVICAPLGSDALTGNNTRFLLGLPIPFQWPLQLEFAINTVVLIFIWGDYQICEEYKII